jgi:hypothetical protein
MKNFFYFLFTLFFTNVIAQNLPIQNEIWYLTHVEIDNVQYSKPDNDILGYETYFNENQGSLTICNWIELNYYNMDEDDFLLSSFAATLQECPDQLGLDEFENKFLSLFYFGENEFFTYLIETNTEWNHMKMLSITNSDGNIAYFTNDALSINDTTKESNIIYPNPVVDQLNIQLSEKLNNVNVKIFDQAGQISYDKKFNTMNAKQTIDMKTFPAGVYMIYIKSDEGTITKKIIKK